jgi:hypothetical protein
VIFIFIYSCYERGLLLLIIFSTTYNNYIFQVEHEYISVWKL